MTPHPYDELRSEYAHRWSTMRITRTIAARAAASHLLASISRYEEVQKATGVPAALIAVIHERESDADFHTYLGNGEPLTRRTTLVPKGRGPFTGASAWQMGAEDALHLDGLDQITEWPIERILFECEVWNGFGYRAAGIVSPYLWAGTDQYSRGKWTSDGPGGLDRAFVDPQLGTAALLWALFDAAPELRPTPSDETAAPDAPKLPAPSPALRSSPSLAGGGGWSALRIQQTLNKLGARIAEDNSYGRETRAAVKDFQLSHGLTADGWAGAEQTIPALEEALAEKTSAGAV